MAVKMRLRREGKKKQPFYRVVVADVRSPRDGRFIEDIGYYQPTNDPSTIKIDAERALYWLRTGVQASDAVVKLLRIEGVWEQFKPGDTGKDRSLKHQQRATATAAKDATRQEAEDAARRVRAAAAAEAAEQAAAEQRAAEQPEVEVAAELAADEAGQDADSSTEAEAETETADTTPEPVEVPDTPAEAAG